MKKIVELCTPCRLKLSRAGYALREISGGVDNKVTCRECKKRKYGSVYEMETVRRRKAGKDGTGG